MLINIDVYRILNLFFSLFCLCISKLETLWFEFGIFELLIWWQRTIQFLFTIFFIFNLISHHTVSAAFVHCQDDYFLIKYSNIWVFVLLFASLNFFFSVRLLYSFLLTDNCIKVLWQTSIIVFCFRWLFPLFVSTSSWTFMYFGFHRRENVERKIKSMVFTKLNLLKSECVPSMLWQIIILKLVIVFVWIYFCGVSIAHTSEWPRHMNSRFIAYLLC